MRAFGDELISRVRCQSKSQHNLGKPRGPFQPIALAFVSLTLLFGLHELRGAVPAPGSVDSSFITPSVNDTIWSVAYQADGKVLIGGYLTNVAGQTRMRLARLNSEGALDDGFTYGISGV